MTVGDLASPRRELILLRHAKSDWSGDEPDPLRPLAKRGRRQAPEAGRWLAEHLGAIDLAVVSTATRAQQTWQLASAELAVPPPVRIEDRAYAASAGELLDLVRALPRDAGAVVIVGHNPGLEDFATALTGRSVPMPTSALAVIALAGDWAGDWGSVAISGAVLRASGRPPEGGLS
jgi:phosphohistidine phosphatase